MAETPPFSCRFRRSAVILTIPPAREGRARTYCPAFSFSRNPISVVKGGRVLANPPPESLESTPLFSSFHLGGAVNG